MRVSSSRAALVNTYISVFVCKLACFLEGTQQTLFKFYLVTEILNLGVCLFNQRVPGFRWRTETSGTAGPTWLVGGAEHLRGGASICQTASNSSAPHRGPSRRAPGSSLLCSLLTVWSKLPLTQESLAKQTKCSCHPLPLPRLKAPGVEKLELGPRGATGVDGTEPVACTAVSVLSAATELGMGVLGFSCFCCTASSCRRSEPRKGLGLSPSFG